MPRKMHHQNSRAPISKLRTQAPHSRGMVRDPSDRGVDQPSLHATDLKGDSQLRKISRWTEPCGLIRDNGVTFMEQLP
jgi:hypothetical protein